MTGVLSEFLLMMILAALLLIVSALLARGFKIKGSFIDVEKAPWWYQLVFAGFAIGVLWIAITGKLQDTSRGRPTIEIGRFTFNAPETDVYPEPIFERTDGELRLCRVNVAFTERFVRAPVVALSIVGFQLGQPNEDAKQTTLKRIDAYVVSVTERGFDIELRVWSKWKKPSVVNLSWIAIEK